MWHHLSESIVWIHSSNTGIGVLTCCFIKLMKFWMKVAISSNFHDGGRNTNCISNVNVRKNCWHGASFFGSETVYDSAAFQISITRFRFQWRWQQPAVFIVNFEHISHFFSVSVGDFEQVNLHSFFIRTSKIGP